MIYNGNGLTFEYSFESDAAGSYLVISLDSGHKLLKHQGEIICQNPNSAFAAFHIRRENGNIRIYYSITSRIALSQYLERKRLNRKELLDLLGSIAKGLMLHGNYLLELSGFVIHPDFIFVNPATAEVSLIYVPVSCCCNSTEVCRTFLRELVVNSADVDDDARDNYMQRILSYLKLDTFNLKDFIRLLVDLRYNEGIYEDKVVPEKAKNEKQHNDSIAIACTLPTSKSPEGNSVVRVFDWNSMLKIMIVQLLIILPLIIICLFLKSRGMGDLVSIVGMIIIAAALDILIMRRISGKQVEKTHSTGVRKSMGKERGSRRETVPAIDMIKACDTVMISENTRSNHPYLEGTGDRAMERIMLNKGRFVIGRLGSMVDHIIKDSTIGKLHAEIVFRDGCCYLKDLNSKNGTYINGVRITSNEEHVIMSDFKIKFSGHEYIFRQ